MYIVKTNKESNNKKSKTYNTNKNLPIVLYTK